MNIKQQEIYRLGCETGERANAIDSIRYDYSLEQFQDDIGRKTETGEIINHAAGGFSIQDLIFRLTYPQDESARGRFERDICEIEKDYLNTLGIDSIGVPVSKDILSINTRTLTTNVNNMGGHLVADQIIPSECTEYRYENTALLKLSVKLDNLKEDARITKLSGRATSAWVADETTAGAKQTQTFGSFTLTPHFIKSYVDISKTLLVQSSLGIENLIKMDMAKSIGTELDKAIISGSGASGQPTGLLNLTGFDNETLTTDIISFEDLVGLETKIRTQNAENPLGVRLGWALDDKALEFVRRMNAGYSIYSDGRIFGHQAEISTLLADGAVIFGNWDDSIVGLWGGLDLFVDDYSLSNQDMIRIVVTQMMDYGVRRIESFSRIVAA